MSKKLIIYRVYSICLLLISGVSVVASLVFVFRSFNMISLLSLIYSLICSFFMYVEFSSYYSFSDMIKHDKRGAIGVFRRKAFAFSPKFYKSYGFVIFVVCCIFMAMSSIAGIIVSVVLKTNIIFTFCSILILAFSVLQMYFTYNLRYKAFSGLLLLFETGDNSELRNQKTHCLRMYGTFLIVISVISVIFLLFLSIICISAITKFFGLWTILFSLPCGIVLVFCYIPLLANCMLYFDLADMIERYMTSNNTIRNDIKVGKEIFINKKSILNYKYAGGIYSVAVWLNVILLVICFVAELFVIRPVVTKVMSGNVVALLSDDYSVYSLFLTITSILIIIGMSLALYHCFLNRNTDFQIFDNGIKGTAVVNDGFTHKVRFELNKEDINSISVQGMFFVIVANGVEYRIMITSRDFKRRLLNVINKEK